MSGIKTIVAAIILHVSLCGQIRCFICGCTRKAPALKGFFAVGSSENKDIRSNAPYRVGLGYDIHRFADVKANGKPLKLGGIEVPNDSVRIVSHSDGDVILHSVSDAILGGIGMGDIGEHFPDNDPRNENLDSKIIIGRVLDMASKSGHFPVNVDVNIILERPKLGRELKGRIHDSLRKIFGNDTCINIKAKTNEGLDAIGSRLAIACQSTVLLQRID